MFVIKQRKHGGADMWCSVDDTIEFDLTGFPEGAIVEFVISKSERTEPIIANTYNLAGESALISLEKNERKKITKGEYVYKLTIITAEGKKYTQLSGDFIVDWGVRYE